MAMTLLIKRGADPNIAAKNNGVTPLWAAVKMQWQPRTRFPQPQEMELQKATYLEVMQALLDKGADPNQRIRSHPWYHGLHRLRQPQLRARRHLRLDGHSGARPTASTSMAMKLLVKLRRRSEHPDDGAARAARGGGGGPPRGAPAGADHADGRSQGRSVTPRRRFRTAVRALSRFTPRRAWSTAKASPATPIVMRRMGGLPAMKYLVEELRRGRQRARQRRLHAAPSRGGPWRQRDDSVSRLQGRRRQGGRAQRPDDGGHGQRPRAAPVADSRDRRAADEAGIEEQQSLRYLLDAFGTWESRFGKFDDEIPDSEFPKFRNQRRGLCV